MILTPPEINNIVDGYIEHVRTITGPEKTILLNKACTESIDVVIEKLEGWRASETFAFNASMDKIRKKIEKYRRTDAQLRRTMKTNLRPTMTACEGFELLVRSHGRCAMCKQPVKLYGWEPLDRYQFSFDRLNDWDTHHVGNCQITCLACNHEKANKYMKFDIGLINRYRGLKRSYFLNPDENTRRELVKLYWVLNGTRLPNKWQQIKTTKK